MRNWDSTEYYAARELQERALAADSREAAVAAIHQDMAERYALLLWPRHSVHGAGRQQRIDAEE